MHISDYFKLTVATESRGAYAPPSQKWGGGGAEGPLPPLVLRPCFMNKNKTHCNGGLSPLPCQRFKKKATSMEAAVEFKHQLFQLERNTKHNGRIFTRYASENGDFNRGRKSFQANTMLKFLTRVTKKTKRSWIYMREN